MKTFITVLLAVLLIIAGNASAKMASIEVDFSFDSDYESEITGYKLYCITVPGSAVRVLMATLNDPAARTWITQDVDIPPGKTLDWYMTAVYNDGAEGYSPAYQFKLTGNPHINSIRVTK